MVLAALAIATPAWAEAPPAVLPTRDVDVTYRVPVPGTTDSTSLLQRLRWSAGLLRQRVDLPTSGNWMVVDFATHKMAVVRDEEHAVLELPAPQAAATPGGFYARQGQANIAGLPCTEWQTTDTRGQQTVACYTQDGVLLRARAGDRVLMEATSVTYATQAEQVFDIPKEYKRQEQK